MKELKITCDQCGEDITTTGNCVDYRIVLANQSIPSLGGVVTAMDILPHLKHDYYYFCSTDCLKEKVKSL